MLVCAARAGAKAVCSMDMRHTEPRRVIAEVLRILGLLEAILELHD